MSEPEPIGLEAGRARARAFFWEDELEPEVEPPEDSASPYGWEGPPEDLFTTEDKT